MKKYIFLLLSIAVIALLFEIFAGIGLLYLASKKNLTYRTAADLALTDYQKETIRKFIDGEEKYTIHDPILGWTVKPGGSKPPYKASAQGLRANREYSFNPTPHMTRIATFGDSFTHGDEVYNDETWQTYLEKLDPNLEVLNFGVAGYGTDQAYLRYLHDGRPYKPDIVIIGFTSENPFRNVNIFRPFYGPTTHLPLSKPRFTLAHSKLKLIDNPLKSKEDYLRLLTNGNTVLTEIIKHDSKYNRLSSPGPFDRLSIIQLARLLIQEYKLLPKRAMAGHFFNPQSDEYRITLAVLEEFYSTASEDGAVPVIVVFANGGDIMRLKYSGHKNYQTFLDSMTAHNWKVLDLADLILQDSQKTDISLLFAPQGHYSPLENQNVAQHIYDYLVQNGLISKPEPAEDIKKTADSGQFPEK